MASRHDTLPNYLPSPARRVPTQEFDYQELVADPTFHAVVDEHRRNGSFVGLEEGTPEYNSKLNDIAVGFVAVVNEKRATLFRNLGILNGRRGAFREAISCYNRALELSNKGPSKHVTLANRSAAYIKSQMFAEALEDAQEAAYLCSDYSIAHSLMGYCHTRLGLGKKAVVNYNMALQLNPGDKSSRGLLADAKKSLIHAGETLETIKALEAPFVAKREAEQVSIDASATAPVGVPAMHQRCIDRSEKARSVQTMKKTELPPDGGLKGSSTGKEARRISSYSSLPSKTKNGTDRPSLSRKLSGSAQAFASLTGLPGKLKNAIGKKNRGRSSTKGKAQLSGTTLAKDFGGLYGDGAEDAVIAPRPTCTGGEAALGEPEVFRMEVQKIGSNPLFYAERSRGREGTSNITASPTPVAPDRVFAASSCGESGGEAVEGVFCASRHSPGGSVARSSSETGGGPAVQTSHSKRAPRQERRPQKERPQRQGLPAETPPRSRPVNNSNSGAQRPGAHMSVAQLRDRSRRRSKNRTSRESGPCPARPASQDSTGMRTPSVTPPLAENRRSKPPPCPAKPTPRLRAAQGKTGTSAHAVPQPNPDKRKGLQTVQAARLASASTKPPNVRGRIGAGWVPGKSGYASSESDEFSDAIPVRSRASAASSTGRGGEAARDPSALSDTNIGREGVSGIDAAVITARPPGKAGWTTSGSVSDLGLSETMGSLSGYGGPLRFNTSASTEVLMRDEDGVDADGALGRTLGEDSDCGSVFPRFCPDGLREKTGRGREEMSADHSSNRKAAEAEAQAFQRRGSILSLDGGGKNRNERLVRRGDHRRSSSAAGERLSAVIAGNNDDDSSPIRSNSVRDKIALFERSVYPSSGTEDTGRKDPVTPSRTGHIRALTRSLSTKIRGHNSNISADTTKSTLSANSDKGIAQRLLARSRSFQISARASAPPAGMTTNDANMAEGGARPSSGS